MALRAKAAKGTTAKRSRGSAKAVSVTSPATVSKADELKVRAIALGYYGAQLREEGDTFELRDPEHFSSSWMEKI
ncbi:hypothetical protein [Kiloniella sp. EL199]|uniref:hypothetical protein n=1 Tax=Kiloniella sp. EL199 TaxID=2107581 RepID=UPI000EA2252E|nr:hypothetical protein [Kiloniella sp. EL199]